MSNYLCRVCLPKKVYQDDAENISLILHKGQKTRTPAKSSNSSKAHGDRDEKALQIGANDQFIEVELLAAGLAIDGERKQRKAINSATLEYWWNCHFANSGVQKVIFIVRIIDSSGERAIYPVEHKCRVAKFDHLTKRDISLLGAVTKVGAFIALVLAILLSIAQVAHVAGLR